MHLWTAILGCIGPGERYVTFTGSYSHPTTEATDTWTWSDPFAWAAWTCPADRDEGWDDWPGGQRMWLDAGTAVVGSPLTISVTGATPGDLIEFRRGNLCRLDCPSALDGGCFHPARSNVVGLAVAGNDGVAVVEIPVSIGWSGSWWVMQARAVDADEPYVSQPFLAHTEDWLGPFPAQLPFREVSTVSVRGLGGAFEGVWPVAAGQWGTLYTTAEPSAVAATATSGSQTGAIVPGVPFVFGAPATAIVRVEPDDGAPLYDLDLAIGPPAAAIAWYTDADGDGWGDDGGPPEFSVEPIAGRAPNASDCDDADPAHAPFAAESCGDGIDQDCDGADRSCAAIDGTRIVGPSALPAAEPSGVWLGAGDLDGDGANELVVAPIGVAAELGRADVDLAFGSLLPAGTWMGPATTLGDLDGDGAVDLVTDRDGALQILLGPLSSAEPWDPAAAIAHGSWIGWPPAWVEAGDLDGDGKAELIVPAAEGAYWIPDPLNDAEPALELPLGTVRPNVADLDGDGIEDLVTGDGCARIGPFPDPLIDCLEASESAGPPLAFSTFTSGDADGDGRADLAAALSSGPAYVVTSAPPWVEGSAQNAAWLAIVETDPIVSLAVQAGDPGQIAGVSDQGLYRSWLVSAAGGGTLELTTAAAWLFDSVGPSVAYTGDLDGDGADDLAVSVTGSPWADRPDPGLVWISWAP